MKDKTIITFSVLTGHGRRYAWRFAGSGLDERVGDFGTLAGAVDNAYYQHPGCQIVYCQSNGNRTMIAPAGGTPRDTRTVEV